MSRAIRHGRLLRRLGVLAAAVLAAAIVESTAAAAPVPGGTFVSGAWWPTPTYLFFTTAGGSPSGGLSGLGCPFLPQEGETEAQTSQLTYDYNGWLGPIEDEDTNPNQQVLLRTHVAGAVEDAAGNGYRLAGDFVDSTTHFLFEPDLLFDGVGRVTLAGGAGVVVGTAELRLVSAPLDYAFVFTSIKKCNIGGAS